jgi:carbonic anhydrase
MDLSRRRLLLGVPGVAAAALIAPVAAAAEPHQSPIQIRSRDAVTARDLPLLEVDYPRQVDLRVHYVRRDEQDPAGCTVRGHEEAVQVDVPAGAGGVRLEGVHYELIQFHFHTPAEHQLDWNRFPLEQHWEHRGPNGETLVLGLFLAPGGTGDTVQDTVLGGLPDECGPEHQVSGDLAAALPLDLSTFRYQGSQTTDPYSEPVSWLVLARHGMVAEDSAKAYRRLFPDGNAREPQPLNGRVVQYRPQ